MNRSVRNGIAVAGMAGGLWFLGHAVANADTGQTASADNTTSTSSTDSGAASNNSTNVAKAENSNSTTVSTGTIAGGNGGTNTASINTGVSSGGGGTFPSNTASSTTSSSSSGGSSGGTHVSVTTGSVTVTQQANGGSVSGSGNVSVNNSVTQSASASNHVTQTSSNSSSSGGSKSWGGDKSGQDSVSANDVGGDGHGGGGNDSTNVAVARNDNSTEVYTGDIYGGEGGYNEADINTGLIMEPVFDSVVPFSDSQSGDRHHHGSVDITVATGAVWVRQEANGGDVSGSGNVDVNGNVHQSASASNDVTQTSTSSDSRKHKGDWWFGGKAGGNDSRNKAIATNDNWTDIYTGDIYGGDGGYNYLEANTGVIEDYYPFLVESFSQSEGNRHHRSIDVQASSGDVSATQEANGGDVTGSGNVSVCDSTDQSASASNDVTQNSTSSNKVRGDNGRGNHSTNKAIARNDNSTFIETGDIYGGNGGFNEAAINTGVIGSDFYGELPSSLDVTTGDVTVTQEANGGDVTGSGNVSVGSNKGACGCQQASAPTPAPAPKPCAEKSAQKPAEKAATMTTETTAKKHAVTSGAQPTGALAVTGAETSAPLTAGLLALGAGAALTLAGRRRREAQDS